MKKMRLRTFCLSVWIALVVFGAFAAPIDEAKRLYADGHYKEALEKLKPLAKRSPRDMTVNYYMGATLNALGKEAEAITYLEKAESRGLGVASEMLANIALEHYNVPDAEEHMATWSENLKKARKTAPESYENLSSRLVTMRNMLDRVERIEVVDSVDVDSASFFEYYRLSKSAGNILPPDAVQSLVGANVAPFSPAFMPETRNELFWSAEQEGGDYELMNAGILDDGTLDHPASLGAALGMGANAAYPFLMTDGATLYFASDGEGSIGGYDIFMTRRNDEGNFFSPQNIGMPYNSPDNDFMLAIDETTGLGWWATDRNHVPGKVTIYVYLPSDVRVNVDPSSEDIEALAKLNNIALTRDPEKNYRALLDSKLPGNQKEEVASGSPHFEIDMGNGKVYTSLQDFRNKEACSTMLELISQQVELRKMNEKLDALRERYRKGDSALADEILDAENQAGFIRNQIAVLRNKAVRLETESK